MTNIWTQGWTFAGETGETTAFWIGLQVSVFSVLVVVRAGFSAVRQVAEWIIRVASSMAAILILAGLVTAGMAFTARPADAQTVDEWFDPVSVEWVAAAPSVTNHDGSWGLFGGDYSCAMVSAHSCPRSGSGGTGYRGFGWGSGFLSGGGLAIFVPDDAALEGFATAVVVLSDDSEVGLSALPTGYSSSSNWAVWTTSLAGGATFGALTVTGVKRTVADTTLPNTLTGAQTPQIWITTQRCAYSLRVEPTVAPRSGDDSSLTVTSVVVTAAVVRYSAALSPACPAIYMHAYSGFGPEYDGDQFAEGRLGLSSTCTFPARVAVDDPAPGTHWRLDFAHYTFPGVAPDFSFSPGGCDNGIRAEGDAYSICVRARILGGLSDAQPSFTIRWTYSTTCDVQPPELLTTTPPTGVLVPGLGDVTDWSWDEAWTRVSQCWESDLDNPVQSAEVQEWWERGGPDWVDSGFVDDTAILGGWWTNIKLAVDDLVDLSGAVWTTGEQTTTNLINAIGEYTGWAVGAVSCTGYRMMVPLGDNMNSLMFGASGCQLLVREDGTLETGADFGACNEQASIMLWWLSGLYGIGAPTSVWDCQGPHVNMKPVTDIILNDILKHPKVMGPAYDLDLSSLSGYWISSCPDTTMGTAADKTSEVVGVLQYAFGVFLLLGFARAMPYILGGKL